MGTCVSRRQGGLAAGFMAVICLASQRLVWADLITTPPSASDPYLNGSYAVAGPNFVTAAADGVSRGGTSWAIGGVASPVFTFGSISLGTQVGDELLVSGVVGIRGQDARGLPTFTPYQFASSDESFAAPLGMQSTTQSDSAESQSLSSELLTGTVLGSQLTTGNGNGVDVDYYLVGVTGGQLEDWCGPQVVAAVYLGGSFNTIQMYSLDSGPPVVPEPTAIMVWSLLGPAGIVFAARAWRRRNSSG
jgi:hypothetical protein